MVLMYACAYMYAYACGPWRPDVDISSLFSCPLPYFLTESLTKPRARCFDWTGWPAGPKICLFLTLLPECWGYKHTATLCVLDTLPTKPSPKPIKTLLIEHDMCLPFSPPPPGALKESLKSPLLAPDSFRPESPSQVAWLLPLL